MFTRAITRKPAATLGSGLTTADLGAPDPKLAGEQHQAYVEALIAAGLQVTVLDELPEFPDAHFVEDVAVVVPEVAVLTRPGALERRGEVAHIAHCFPTAVAIEAPGTLDGGDVLGIGRHFVIGLSERTNRDGAEQLGAVLERHGYTWEALPVATGLHFKSYVNVVAAETLLVTADFGGLEQYDHIVASGSEANTLWVNDRLLMPSGFPQTRERLDALGKSVVELDISEFEKMDGGLTCLSLRF